MGLISLIREARRRAGLTQAELARRAGVPQSTVGRVEAGARVPSTDLAERLIRAAGFDIEVHLVATTPEVATAEEFLAGTPTRSSRVTDTAPDAARRHAEALRTLGISGRAHATFAASDSLREVVRSGTRYRHPDYDDETSHLAFLRLRLGPELFQLIHPGVEVAG